jgi:glycerol uptake facilitator-like aquaporin
MQKYLVEFIGAGVLFCAVVGSGIMAFNLSPDNEGVVLLANTLATSFALYFLIKTFQEYGDAHFNPAVSMVAYLKNELTVFEFFSYSILQCIGAIFGVIFANYMFGLELINFATNLRGGLNIYVSEVFATTGLIMIIFLSRKENVAMSVAAFIGGAYWFTSSTSFANPAATISRAFSDSFAGINVNFILPFIIAQLFGGWIAFLILKFFKKQ